MKSLSNKKRGFSKLLTIFQLFLLIVIYLNITLANNLV